MVDDDDDTREFLIALLEEEGAMVRSASSVAEALAQLESSWPDVLLSDIGMPGIRRLRVDRAGERNGSGQGWNDACDRPDGHARESPSASKRWKLVSRCTYLNQLRYLS